MSANIPPVSNDSVMPWDVLNRIKNRSIIREMLMAMELHINSDAPYWVSIINVGPSAIDRLKLYLAEKPECKWCCASNPDLMHGFSSDKIGFYDEEDAVVFKLLIG